MKFYVDCNVIKSGNGSEESPFKKITEAAKIVANEVKLGKISAEEITQDYFSEKLYSSESPDLDLIIRTAGEQRISNFMLWKAAYAELYFTDVLWPDFDENELRKALKEYSGRVRRFGGA